MAKRKFNPLREDPTRTLTLRNRAVGEINRRFGKIKQLITQSIVKNKVFVDNVEPLEKSNFVFLRTPEKLERFDVWLQVAIQEIILSGSVDLNSPQLNWLLPYLEQAYFRGAQGTNNNLATIYGRNQIPARVAIATVPFHVEKLQLLFSRDFAQLKGISDYMAQQISYELSQGLLQGQNPRKIAKSLNNRVDKIGITRARLLARTEIVNAHNLGRINEGKVLQGLLGEEIVYEWITSGDSRVRPTHNLRGQNYYSYEKVIQLIGEYNCRCAIVAVPISRIPKGTKIRT